MQVTPFQITANVVDLIGGQIQPATVCVEDGRITKIVPADFAKRFLIPGFVDSHIHIESSMLLPAEFARVAVRHGTVATVSDPHEIANVCGVEGIELMLRSASLSPMKFHFGAPSCVPATLFETSGAQIDADMVAKLLDDPRINHLSEVMNFPGVLSGDLQVMTKIHAALDRNLPIDGHAPGLRGEDAKRYIAMGISTDHECVTLEEAEEKIQFGATIAIREGSAARNFDALWPLINRYPAKCMFCSDDKHPDDLLEGHINQLVTRAVQNGCNVMHALQVACLNPVRHYDLDVGLLQVGDPADFVMVENLKDFRVRETYLEGQLVAKDGESFVEPQTAETVNCFNTPTISRDALVLPATGTQIRVIDVLDGQLVTNFFEAAAHVVDGFAVSDPSNDILKIVVVNRYENAAPSIGFVRGFGLRSGALASSVAHDSHNVIAVGVTDEELMSAINGVMTNRGGLSVAANDNVEVLPLPIAGLMSPDACEEVGGRYAELSELVTQLNSSLRAPFMTLSFLALPVIPELKITDRGLFAVHKSQFVSVFESARL